MFKKLFLLAAVVAGFSAQAAPQVPLIDVRALAINVMGDDVHPTKLPWKVGESANYSVDLGGFLKGTMVVAVRELTSEGFWIQQDVDLMIQKSKVEMLFDADNGQLKKMLVDGKEQQLDDGKDTEIIESKPDTVTVPAGKFECAYVKFKNKKDNTTAEAWINPEIIPVFGLIQQKAESQMGPVTVALTSFLKK